MMKREKARGWMDWWMIVFVVGSGTRTVTVTVTRNDLTTSPHPSLV